MSDFSVTDHNRVRRLPARGRYDRASVYAIVDAGLVCHVGFVADGRPYVIPTLHARDGDVIYLHGASTSRMLRAIEQGADEAFLVVRRNDDGKGAEGGGVWHRWPNYPGLPLHDRRTSRLFQPHRADSGRHP